MKPQSDIVAERPLAQHADELIKPREAKPDMAANAQQFGTMLGKALRDPLSALLGGAHLAITCKDAERAAARLVFSHYKPPAAHFIVTGLPVLPSMIISLTRQHALAMCDRAFGGNGAVFDHETPDAEMPFSADLTIARLGDTLAAALGAVSGAGDAVQVTGRGTNLERLATFGCQAQTLSLTLSIAEEECEGWEIGLMGLATGFGAFLASLDKPDASGSNRKAPTGPQDEPFCGIPLSLRAVLAEMRVPVAQISTLSKGDVLPISLRREVPLLAADHELARGTIGSMDDYLALKLTQISSAKGHLQ